MRITFYFFIIVNTSCISRILMILFLNPNNKIFKMHKPMVKLELILLVIWGIILFFQYL